MEPNSNSRTRRRSHRCISSCRALNRKGVTIQSYMEAQICAEYRYTVNACDAIRKIIHTVFQMRMHIDAKHRLSKLALKIVRANKMDFIGSRSLNNGPLEMLEGFTVSARNYLESWFESIGTVLTKQSVKSEIVFDEKDYRSLEGITKTSSFRLCLAAVRIDFSSGRFTSTIHLSNLKTNQLLEGNHVLSVDLPAGSGGALLVFAGIEFFGESGKVSLPFGSGNYQLLTIVKARSE